MNTSNQHNGVKSVINVLKAVVSGFSGALVVSLLMYFGLLLTDVPMNEIVATCVATFVVGGSIGCVIHFWMLKVEAELVASIGLSEEMKTFLRDHP